MTNKPMLDHIKVIYKNEEYSIYADGVVYHTSPCDRDDCEIPQLVFKLRDTYVAGFKG